MSIYITGDTHGGMDSAKLRSCNFVEGKKLSKNDFLIVLGDFGIWKDKRSQEFLEWLDNKKFTTLFVEGNHEDYEYLKTFPKVDMFGNKVRKINDSVYQLLRGEIYTIENQTFFTFGGASSIDKMYRREGFDWFKEEECSYLEESNALLNLEKYNFKVDYILSHTCSSSSLEEIAEYFGFSLEEFDCQNRFFEEIKYKVDYKGWLYGHFHKDFIVNEKELIVYDDVINLEEAF